MLPWNYLELHFFLRHNCLPTPLLCTKGTFLGKIRYHKVILLYQPGTDFSLSFLWQVLQLSPVLVGWMPTPSCPTRQHRAQWSTLEELKSSQKRKLAVHQHLLQHSSWQWARDNMRWAGGNTEPGGSTRDTQQGFSWGKGISPQTHLFFPKSASNSFPKEPQEQELTGAHRLAWILLNIQRYSLILLGISLEIPAKQGSSRASQTALKWTHCLKCAILQKCSRTPAVLLWLASD